MLAEAVRLIQKGAYPQAIGLLQDIVAAQPAHFESRLQLAKAYLDWAHIQARMPLTDIDPRVMTGDVAHYLALAESQLIELVKMRPASPHAQGLLALVHLVYKRPDEAVGCLKKALAKSPLDPELLFNMGFALMGLKRFGEAAKQFARLTALDPKHGMGWHMLGESVRKAGDPAAAIASYRRAMALLPGWPQPYGGLATALIGMGRHAESLDQLERVLALAPDVPFYHSEMLFTMHYHPGCDAEEIARRHRAFGERFETPLKSSWHPHPNVPDRERKLRVGFVSADFRRHSVGYFMADLLAGLQGGMLELVAYSSGGKHDDLTERIKSLFGVWRDCNVLGDDALAARIRADDIDVLVDLAGHTMGNRLLTYARKPAPVQVTYLGYPDTTGLTAMDYIVGDARMFPAEEAALYVETPWRLPDTSLCFTPPDLPVDVGALPAMRNGLITFACLNKWDKITEAVIDTWARILHAVPGSRLLLQSEPYGNAAIASIVRAGFADKGIGADRLELIGKLTWREHLETYNRVDIALDPFPYNGTTTSVEGLWMGVPLLALKGDRLVAHMGESILHTMGMPEWIASDKADYVAKAVAFAGDLPALAAVRTGLRDRLLASPICDAPRFAHNLEAAFRGMWRSWCDQQALARSAD